MTWALSGSGKTFVQSLILPSLFVGPFQALVRAGGGFTRPTRPRGPASAILTELASALGVGDVASRR